MKRKILTDVELRAHWSQTRCASYRVAPGTILTPAAWDFLREQNIALIEEATAAAATGVMTMTPVPMRGGRPLYKVAATGEETSDKPEDMTHLNGNVLVPKTHPRIVFRGKLDSLQAKILELQLAACESGSQEMTDDLGELLEYTKALLGAEVKETPLEDMRLLGMTSPQLRYTSHHVKEIFGIDHPVPHIGMGRLCIELNLLRTQVREVELVAAQTFAAPDAAPRPDLIEALNRLSSCVYIIFCRKLSGYYGGEN